MRSSIGLTAIIAVLGLAPAAAHATTFSGSCPNIKGTATFGKPLNSTQADNTYDFKGTATCSGKMDGVSVKDVPVSLAVKGPGNLSCSSGKSTADGDGTITVDGTGKKVQFKMAFTATASEVDITIKNLAGTKSGHGTASFANKSDPAANLTTLSNCAGAGNKSLSFTADATVDDATPLDDGAPAQQPSTNSNSSNTNTDTNNSAPTDNSTPSNTGSSTTTTEQPKPQSKPKPKAKKKHKAKKKKKKKKKHKAKKKKHKAKKKH